MYTNFRTMENVIFLIRRRCKIFCYEKLHYIRYEYMNVMEMFYILIL